MSPPRSFINRFARRKSSTCKSRFLIANTPTFRRTPNMLALPTELHARILENVSFEDLAAFRLACRFCRYLLHSGDIIRCWLEKHGNRQIMSLYPPPSPPGFHYLIAHTWSWNVANATAKLIAIYIEHEVLRHTLQRLDVHPTRGREELLETTTREVQERLVPLIITTQHYLERFANILLDRYAPLDGPRSHELRTEREVLEFYDPQHLLQVHKFWHFLYWLFNRVLHRDVDRGPVILTANASSPREPFNRYQLRLMLVLGNIPALRTMLSQETPKQRLRTIAAYFRRIDPDLSLLWNRRWGQNIIAQERPDTADKARAVLEVRLGAGEVWFNGARALLIDKGLLRKNGGDEIGAPWQALDFLFDTCGYDALQTPPSMLLLSRVLMQP